MQTMEDLKGGAERKKNAKKVSWGNHNQEILARGRKISKSTNFKW